MSLLCVYDVLPTELIMDTLSFLDARHLAPSMLVSRRFFVLASAILRQKTAVLLIRDEFALTFEIGLPVDGPYQRRHVLSFSHFVSYSDFVPSSPGELTPSGSSDGEDSDASSTYVGSGACTPSEKLWRSPRAVFKFSSKDVPFPIDIEAPYETFRTILWGVWVNREVKPGPSPTERPLKALGYKRLVTKGLERIQDSHFSSSPVPMALPLSDKSSSTIDVTMLPASRVHYRGVTTHDGDPWKPPFLLSSSVYDSPHQDDWRKEPCTCGSQDTYGLQFERLSMNCGKILHAHETTLVAQAC